MPLYEYHCNDCQEAFEKLVSFSEANRSPVCPSCQSPNTHKKLSRIAASVSAGASGGSASASSCSPGGRFS